MTQAQSVGKGGIPSWRVTVEKGRTDRIEQNRGVVVLFGSFPQNRIEQRGTPFFAIFATSRVEKGR